MMIQPVSVRWDDPDREESSTRKIPPVSAWAIRPDKVNNTPAGLCIFIEGPKESLELIFSVAQLVDFVSRATELLEEELAYATTNGGRTFPY